MGKKIVIFSVLLGALLLPLTARAEDGGMDTGPWQLYFGQLHAHTADSDGQGTAAEAFAYAAAVEGLDFFAVTDHSDSFDNDRSGSLTADGETVSQVWAAGKAAARAVTDEDFVGIYGFEMSWNQGQGHMSTFATSGWLSRDQADYRSYKNGLEHYYEALLTAPESVSQFNHPGTLYGDFKNFAWYSAQVDDRVTLIEVGSGTGSEYATAWDAYTRALDQGWHLAPTNNQNNHNGNFGDGDSHRTVILARELTEEAIYDALRNYRVYATEDGDLALYMTLNGAVMGSELSVEALGPEAQLTLEMDDPTDQDWGTVEVITQGGEVAASAPAGEKVSFTLPTHRPYYYLRITQADGDVAVTAPVWLRQKDDIGISVLETKTPVTRAGEDQSIVLTLYNNEAEPLDITSVTVTDQAGDLLAEMGESRIESYETLDCTFAVCFPEDGVRTVTVAATGTFAGEAWTETRELTVTVLPRAVTGDVLVDGTHGETDTYAGLTDLAGEQQTAVHVETQAITLKQLETADLLVIPSPRKAFSEEFIRLVTDYVNQGGRVLLLGGEGAEETNCLLAALGSTMALDTANPLGDSVFSGDIRESDWTEGITQGQIYGQTGGWGLLPGQGEWLVKSPEGRVLLASEGEILLAGGDMMEDAWLTVSDNSWAVPYANRTVLENLLGITRTEAQVTDIAAVRSGEPGRIYLVEGVITAGSHNPNTAFPDKVYLQDATGGIAAVNCGQTSLEPGRRVRIMGCLETEGDIQLRVQSMEILEKTDPVQPQNLGNDLQYETVGGQLIRLEGTVISSEAEGEAVSSFLLEDAEGHRASVQVDAAITSGSLGKNLLACIVQPGNRVSAVGLCSRLNGETVLLIRDCDEVLCLWSPPEETLPETTAPETTPETAAPETTEPEESSEVTEPEIATPETELPTEPETLPETQPTEQSSAKPAPTEPSRPTASAEDSVETNGNPPTGDMSYPGWAWAGIAVGIGILIRCLLLLI